MDLTTHLMDPWTDKAFGLAVATEKQAIQGVCVITKELASGSSLQQVPERAYLRDQHGHINQR